MRNEPEWIEREKTSKGGWTRATLASHGIPWPPPNGWRKRLAGGKTYMSSEKRSAYNAYINSREWKELRQQCLERAGHRCEQCLSEPTKGYPLHAHHLTYARFTQELLSDIKVLCIDCHNATHGRKHKKPRYLTREQWFEQRQMDEMFLLRVAMDQ